MNDETVKPNFEIAKAALKAGRLVAESMELDKITDVVVIVKMDAGDGQVNIASLSTIDASKHLAAMIEATQQFAKGVDIPLEVLYIDPQHGGGADE